ncbi:RDD family protein [Actinokineospora alba]|uniref:RDD family protein n=1 Tax=Actinokineospora alba TaxID=504798 RepID=A0A1H0RZX8_9PSEU|nr:VanZ family protein [Actinokineospora alba]TDP66836.1 RDD family protein [Actinokineospora alba]SDI48467.1 RDD family protein [Actinokineospora alba]SDP35024.1 RDD family protein [Actinokineospora alba]
MTDPQLSAILAFLGGTVLAFLLVLPYVAWSYRRRGEFGLGHAFLAFGLLVYALALWTYTLLPVPDTTAAWCAAHAVDHPQLRPLQFLRDIRADQVGSGIRATLHNPAVQQFVFNVALFVPLGMFGRVLFRRGPVTVVGSAAVVSLFIEFTQLTAVWGLFGCPYRLFDVDDLLANTAGGAIGYLLAPVLRAVPRRRVRQAPDVPRPVTTRRRLFGMLLDLVAVVILGGLLQVVAILVSQELLDRQAPPAWVLGTAVPVAVVLLLVPLLGDGATLGQRAVLLRPLGPDGAKPSVGRILVRFLVGSGGYFILTATPWSGLGTLLLLVSGVMAWRPRDHRGLSGVIAGLRVADTRAGVDTGPEVAHRDAAVESGR